MPRCMSLNGVMKTCMIVSCNQAPYAGAHGGTLMLAFMNRGAGLHGPHVMKALQD